eukprot:8027995-Pyramimonas_sp.AAC.2
MLLLNIFERPARPTRPSEPVVFDTNSCVPSSVPNESNESVSLTRTGVGRVAPTVGFHQGSGQIGRRHDITVTLSRGAPACERDESGLLTCTISRDLSLMSSRRVTSLRTPLSEERYSSSMSRPREAARMRGRPSKSSSGRSMEAMFTRVATASSAEGGTPTTCSPQGSRRDSISISLPYTCREQKNPSASKG